MKKYFAREALLPQGWARDVVISVDKGAIVEVAANSRGGEKLAGPVLPGMANLHSHAFQRAMAGLTEMRGPGEDDFWTWRELMYRFVERVTPAQAKAIAAQLYLEMLTHGYTAVAEFHYVHHPAGMLMSHLEAARDTGIAITLLPSLYTWSGFGRKPLQPRQKRFSSDVSQILSMLEHARRHVSPEANLGVAPHSLRAVDPQALKELVAAVPADAPVHIHAAEQTREVDECKAALGKRPVEWLLSEMPVDRRWCVVHATQVTDEEMRALAASGAVAGLCPTTEGNLGDGIFPLAEYRASHGRYGIGGDSHVSRDPTEELRLLEYFQRVMKRKRNLTRSERNPSVGTTLWLEAAAGGAQALGRRMGAIAAGMRADLVVLDQESVDLTGRSGDAIANAFIFSGARSLVRDVMVAGRWVVREKRHPKARAAAAAYKRTLKALLA
ncbi:MAG TPA: formimidoylglutamate deiminase [Burkholderiales bacterium]|nr:formimidoylglutamate deiminase [Burkholderiales bacterium]